MGPEFGRVMGDVISGLIIFAFASAVGFVTAWISLGLAPWFEPSWWVGTLVSGGFVAGWLIGKLQTK